MRYSFLIVLALVAGCFAQVNVNWKGYSDTAQFTTFAANSVFVSKAFVLSNAENKLLVCGFDDTAAAGHKNDSCKFEFGYLLGTPMLSLGGMWDTIWTNRIPLDTVNTLTASNWYNPRTLQGAAPWAQTSTNAVEGDYWVRPHGQIDSAASHLTGTSSYIWAGFTPYWSPYIKFYAIGLTGNKVGRNLIARFTFLQRNFVYVRQN